jgi:2-polyprenyl-6-methoxyphenol hydroxylase-like FAD-dependent oxidoreductase
MSRPRRIACIGAGPGGLFFATLAKTADPSRDVVVLDRNRPDDTFGFGVVFSDATLAGIHAADPVLRNALHEHGLHWDTIEVRLKGERLRCGGNGMAAIRRQTLLRILRQRAREVGVRLEYETDVDPRGFDTGAYDLVVAGDGAGSRFREHLAEHLEPSFEVATAKFIWFGTTYSFQGLTFIHERSEHGVFAVHGYPIGDGIGTFIVETDEQTWRDAGLDEFDASQPPGPSDERTKDYLEKLFAEQIDGHPLLTNSSRWANFRTRRTARWSHGNVALLGDAAHTAHFSVGSGTKMAMEDAISLSAALDLHPADLDATLRHYEATARPSVEKIQDSARPSLSWWEHFGRYHDAFAPWQFGYHFLSRSIGDRKLRRRDEGFVEGAHRAWRETYGAEPLETPCELPGGAATSGRLLTVSTDLTRAVDVDPHGDGDGLVLASTPPAEEGRRWALLVAAPDQEGEVGAAVARALAAAPAGPALVAVHGGTRLTRVLVSEELRLVHGLRTMLVEPGADADADADRATTLVLSGRADLVGVPA